MLQQVLQEIAQAREPLSVADLARKLQIDPGALEGMINFWVRKGRIAAGSVEGCASGGCGNCGEAGTCPFAGNAPRIFMLLPEER